jgi:hypothetical protein
LGGMLLVSELCALSGNELLSGFPKGQSLCLSRP